jgi:hypothetical protein
MKLARDVIENVVKALEDQGKRVTREHFGSDKRLESTWSGKSEAVRYRSTT